MTQRGIGETNTGDCGAVLAGVVSGGELGADNHGPEHPGVIGTSSRTHAWLRRRQRRPADSPIAHDRVRVGELGIYRDRRLVRRVG
jgi:hypothetical protein